MTGSTVEWKPCPDTDGYYEVSSAGEIRRTCGKKTHGEHPLLKGSITSAGYKQVILIVGNVRVYRRVNRLVCEAWHGPPPSDYHHAAHINGIRLDNRACNLRWATSAENEHDKLRHGTRTRGEKYPKAILTEGAVRDIRTRAGCGESHISLSREYGVSNTTIWLVVARKAWAHVE